MKGKEVLFNENINITYEHTPNTDTENNSKNALASLYSRVLFLKNEMKEKNLLMRPLIIKVSDVLTGSLYK